MLSKSAARAFFLSGTAVCGVTFIGLTLDTFQQLPGRTNAVAITPAVAHGKELWDSNNCMGCHTIFGEGAYYAPELTRVYERRGPVFIASILKDPEALYPGQRKMTNYHFSDAQVQDLIEFLKWVGTVDLNGFPPKPDLSQPVTASLGPRPTVFSQICVACHSLGGQGGAVGPALDGIGDRRDGDYIRRWLHDPTAIKPDSKMPKLPLTEDQIQELSLFLSQQRGRS
ncbi:MAG: c-type cytochrome [Myxococcota bacterium]